MSFYEQIRNTAATMFAIYLLLSNVKGFLSSRHHLLMSTFQSVFLYGSEVRAYSLDKKMNRKLLEEALRRGVLRVTSKYRIVSESPAMVIAGVI